MVTRAPQFWLNRTVFGLPAAHLVAPSGLPPFGTRMLLAAPAASAPVRKSAAAKPVARWSRERVCLVMNRSLSPFRLGRLRRLAAPQAGDRSPFETVIEEARCAHRRDAGRIGRRHRADVAVHVRRLTPGLHTEREIGTERQGDGAVHTDQVAIAHDCTTPAGSGQRGGARVAALLAAVALVDRARVALPTVVAVAVRRAEIVAHLVGGRVDVPGHGRVVDVEAAGDVGGESVVAAPGGRLGA